MKIYPFWLFSLIIAFSAPLSANDDAARDEVAIEQWTFSIFLGEGKIENPIVNFKDLDVILFPSVSYYGEKFFLEGTTLGYSLLENDEMIVDVVGLLNDDGMFYHFEDQQDLTVSSALGFNPIRGPIKPGQEFKPVKRDLSYLGGVSFTVINDYFDTRIGYFQDVTGVHHGHEIHFSIATSFANRWFNTLVEVGQVIKSREIVEYYYRFQPEELSILEGVDELKTGGKSHNFYYKVQVDVPITESFAVVGIAKYTKFGNHIKQSLLVEDSNYLTSFVGLRYQF
ncbi:MipA/OmpV family protein [Thalassotalea sp. ND16A]|uniref:MipA/OmpV family protein n=1 Tax=Thalassotalea sp. ND16A TaxID=1535422 RepID=UPI00051A864C|nr:MipA/OmpV family protein [Thalassotalea sp. ND16A]KGJ98055.1 hypothetical protein ND16A_0860 [Thalassotalea sp. ND16A]